MKLHDHRCKKHPQTPIKRLRGDPSEDFIRKIQTSTFISSRNLKANLPEDADTIPPFTKTEKGLPCRYISRSEAISRIKSDKLILHREEIEPRDSLIEDVIKTAIGYNGPYFITQESSFLDFFERDSKLRVRTRKNYQAFAKIIEDVYGQPICPGCLYQARYIWREIDIILRYQSRLRFQCQCGDWLPLYRSQVNNRFNHIRRCNQCEIVYVSPQNLDPEFKDNMPCLECHGFMFLKENKYLCNTCRCTARTEAMYLADSNKKPIPREKPPKGQCYKCDGETVLTAISPDVSIYRCTKCNEVTIPGDQIDKYMELSEKRNVRVTDRSEIPPCPCGGRFVLKEEICGVCDVEAHNLLICEACDRRCFVNKHEKIAIRCFCGGEYAEQLIQEPAAHYEYVCSRCDYKYLTKEQAIDLKNATTSQ